MELPPEAVRALHSASYDQILDRWVAIVQAGGKETVAALGRTDRFFLLVHLLKRPDLLNPWLYARCREVEANPDGYLDLWGREMFKSTIITFAGSIQEILKDPNICIGIFSHTKSIARGFLGQIKREFETNEALKLAYPDVLWQDPAREAPQWSLDGGIIVRRVGNPKEATVEGHGLVDGMPTSKHFGLLVYDDVVTLESVNTPEQVAKTTEAWSLSDNLGARGPNGLIRKWHAGTRYHFADTYNTILERQALIPRIYPATHDGTPSGNPVLLTPQAWAKKKIDQGPAIIATQMLLNPAAGTEALFKKEWLAFTDIRPDTLNVYIMVDPASSKKRGSDYTAMAVVGVDANWNKYLLDGIRDRLNLKERWHWLRQLRKHWSRQPGVQFVDCGYERYGMQSDIEFFELEMQRDRDVFPIRELAWPRDDQRAKYDRIQRLVPDFHSRRFFLPAVLKEESATQRRVRGGGQAHQLLMPTRRKDYEGNLYSLNEVFQTEFLVYPYSVHDDLLDAISRIYDMEPMAPMILSTEDLMPTIYADGV